MEQSPTIINTIIPKIRSKNIPKNPIKATKSKKSLRMSNNIPYFHKQSYSSTLYLFSNITAWI